MASQGNRFSALTTGNKAPRAREQRTKAAPAPKPVANKPDRRERRSNDDNRSRGRGGHGGRGRRGGHGGRGRGYGGDGSRRNFDRQGGSRNNDGANWGSEGDDIKDYQKNAESAPAVPEMTEEERKAKELEELGPENKSYDQFQAEKAAKMVQGTVRTGRSRNRGFQGRETTVAKPANKSEDVKTTTTTVRKKKGAKHQTVSIDAIAAPSRRNNDRDNRRGNNNRGPKNRGKLNLQSQEEFPTIG